MRALILLAASGLAREVLSSARASGHVGRGILDDRVDLHGTVVGGLPVLGAIESVVRHPDCSFVACVGQGLKRRDIVERLAHLGIGENRYATVIDPSVRVPRSCHVGSGSILLAHTVLTADATIGQHVVAMPNVTVTHDNHIGDYVTLCAGVSVGGGVSIGPAAYLGMNASIREGLTVGEASVLGMGAALTRPLPPFECWVGVPARPLRTPLRDNSRHRAARAGAP